MMNKKTNYIIILCGILFASVFFCTPGISSESAEKEYEVLAWNDLGMHCYDADFSVFSILPPYNTIWAQVIVKGSPPRIVTKGIDISYEFENNTHSADKTNFWQYSKKLFGVRPADNIGLKGKGLKGKMDLAGNYFIAEGIPLTEKKDDGSILHYQTAVVTAKDLKGNILAQTRCIVPLSTEMHCSNCHNDGKIMGIATNNYRTNILGVHDKLSKTDLLKSQPVLCASCHPSNALGTKGKLISLSHAIHKHHEFIEGSLDGCYNCHPGKDTKCLRGVMFANGMVCTDCHGNMRKVGDTGRNPWLEEPDCIKCHPHHGSEPGKLFRMSKGHGGLYCEACHNSTHAEYPSSMAADNMQPVRLQNSSGPIGKCSVCHTEKVKGTLVHMAAD